MKNITMIAAALLAFSSAYPQKIMISGKEGNRPLVWADFKGDPDNAIPYYANTYWGIATEAQNIKPEGDSVFVGKFQVTLQLDNTRSWVKAGKQADALLKHEQGHFDTGILCMRELISRCEGRKFSKKDFGKELQAVFDSTLKKYAGMGAQYDAETNHGVDKAQQLKWEQFFQDKLSGK